MLERSNFIHICISEGELDRERKRNPGKDHFWIYENFFVYISSGTAQNVRLPNTEFSLDILEGSCGYFLMRIFTDDHFYRNCGISEG